jgi:hypothetical protein
MRKTPGIPSSLFIFPSPSIRSAQKFQKVTLIHLQPSAFSNQFLAINNPQSAIRNSLPSPIIRFFQDCKKVTFIPLVFPTDLSEAGSQVASSMAPHSKYALHLRIRPACGSPLQMCTFIWTCTRQGRGAGGSPQTWG